QPESDRASERTLAVCLALVAGYVDACGFRTFGTFVSFMSGNTTQAGLLLGQRQTAAAMSYVIAILCFVGGSITGTSMTQPVSRRSRQFLFTTVSVLLGISTVIMQAGSPDSRLMILMLASSMGMMNTALSRVGSEGVSLTFVTGGLSRVGSHLAMA